MLNFQVLSQKFLVMLTILGVILLGVEQPVETHKINIKSNFNFIFKYGVNARNMLNTFEKTYRKDMIVDPFITIELSLYNEELDSIYQKMIEIDFFNYPDTFSIYLPGKGYYIHTPYYSYYFKVECDSIIKELWWEDKFNYYDKNSKDEKSDKLKDLIKYIINIIESKREYKALPKPRGGYLQINRNEFLNLIRVILFNITLNY